MDAFGAIGELPIAALRDIDVGATGLGYFPLSDDGYISEPGDSPANTYFEARLIQPLYYNRSLAARDGFAGLAADGAGEIRAANFDRYFDTLIDRFSINGRQIRVKRRRLDQALAAAEIIFDGTAPGWESPEGVLRIPLRDTLWKLRVPLQQGSTHRYAGTGSAEGGADLKDKPKPLLFGNCKFVQAVLIDPATWTFQVHDGQIEAIDAVYDLGVSVAFTANLATGTFTLTSSPTDGSNIKADVRGSKLGGSYVDSTAYICRRIIVDHVGLAGSFVDFTSFGNVDGATASSSAEVGIYIGAEDVLAIDVLDALLVGIGGYLAVDRVGRVVMGVFGAPWYRDTFEIDDSAIEAISRVALPASIDPPNKRRQVAYARCWAPQFANLNTAMTAAQRKFVAQPFRTAAATGDASGADLMATDPPIVAGLFADEADALAEAQRLIALYGVPRAFYRVQLSRGLWQFELNQAGTLTYPGWNLSNGRAARIVSIIEDAAAGKVELLLFV